MSYLHIGRTHAHASFEGAYRASSLRINRKTLGPYSRTMPRVLGGSSRGGRFLMGEVTLHCRTQWQRTYT